MRLEQYYCTLFNLLLHRNNLKKLKETNSVPNAKHNCVKTIRSLENIDHFKETMIRSPQKPTRRPSSQLNIKRTSCHYMRKHLEIRAMHELKEKILREKKA